MGRRGRERNGGRRGGGNGREERGSGWKGKEGEGRGRRESDPLGYPPMLAGLVGSEDMLYNVIMIGGGVKF
jgi:hypothetical protein